MKQLPHSKNQLADLRRRRGLQQKQVAALLGHRTNNYISQFECGTLLPSLKTAIMLSIIYQVPVRVLLSGFFEYCLGEVTKRSSALIPVGNILNISKLKSEYCTIDERLNSEKISVEDSQAAYSHTAMLIRKRMEKLGHVTPPAGYSKNL